jgi:hypothetical protein
MGEKMLAAANPVAPSPIILRASRLDMLNLSIWKDCFVLSSNCIRPCTWGHYKGIDKMIQPFTNFFNKLDKINIIPSQRRKILRETEYHQRSRYFNSRH